MFFRLKGLDDDITRSLSTYAAALDLAATASGNAKSIYFSKAQDALRAMSKWLQEKQMTQLTVTYGGKSKPLQDWVRDVSMRDKARLGSDELINFRDVVNVVSGLALGQHFADLAPEYPAFSLLLTEINRKQYVGSALRRLAGGSRTKDAVAVLDALEMLDGDRIEPARSRYAQEVLHRLQAKGHGQVVNRGELLSGATDIEYFAPVKFRLEPDLLVAVLAGLVYSGDIVLAITGDKIDAGSLSLLAERSLDDLKAFKHIEAPKEINVSVLRALFEALGLPTGLAQMATQADVDTQKRSLAILAQVERLRDLVADLGTTAAYLSQAEMILPSDHPWIAQVQPARKEILDAVGARLRARLRATWRTVATRLAPAAPEARRWTILEPN